MKTLLMLLMVFNLTLWGQQTDEQQKNYHQQELSTLKTLIKKESLVKKQYSANCTQCMFEENEFLNILHKENYFNVPTKTTYTRIVNSDIFLNVVHDLTPEIGQTLLKYIGIKSTKKNLDALQDFFMLTATNLDRKMYLVENGNLRYTIIIGTNIIGKYVWYIADNKNYDSHIITVELGLPILLSLDSNQISFLYIWCNKDGTECDALNIDDINMIDREKIDKLYDAEREESKKVFHNFTRFSIVPKGNAYRDINYSQIHPTAR